MKITSRRIIKLIFLVIITAITLLFFNIPVVNSTIKNTIYSVFSPIQRPLWSAGANMHSFFDNLSKMNNATANNEKLQQQITALQAQILELETLKKENDFCGKV